MLLCYWAVPNPSQSFPSPDLRVKTEFTDTFSRCTSSALECFVSSCIPPCLCCPNSSQLYYQNALTITTNTHKIKISYRLDGRLDIFRSFYDLNQHLSTFSFTQYQDLASNSYKAANSVTNNIKSACCIKK